MSNIKAKIGIVLGVLVALAPLADVGIPVYASAGAAIAGLIAAFYHPSPKDGAK